MSIIEADEGAGSSSHRTTQYSSVSGAYTAYGSDTGRPLTAAPSAYTTNNAGFGARGQHVPYQHGSNPSVTGASQAGFIVTNPHGSDRDEAASIGPLPPIPAGAANGTIRRARQKELEQQMQAIKEEMKQLKSVEVMRRKSLPAEKQGLREEEEDSELRRLRDQIAEMTEQIAFLRNQTTSPWALGETDQAPPSYTPRQGQ